MKLLTSNEFAVKLDSMFMKTREQRDLIIVLVTDIVFTFHNCESDGMKKATSLVQGLIDATMAAEAKAVEKILKGSTHMQVRIIGDARDTVNMILVGTSPDESVWKLNMEKLSYAKFLEYFQQTNTKGMQDYFSGDKKSTTRKATNKAEDLVTFTNAENQTMVQAMISQTEGKSDEEIKVALQAGLDSLSGKAPAVTGTGYEWNNPVLGEKVAEIEANLIRLDSVENEMTGKGNNAKTAGAKAMNWATSQATQTMSMVATVSSLVKDMANLVSLNKVV